MKRKTMSVFLKGIWLDVWTSCSAIKWEHWVHHLHISVTVFLLRIVEQTIWSPFIAQISGGSLSSQLYLIQIHTFNKNYICSNCAVYYAGFSYKNAIAILTHDPLEVFSNIYLEQRPNPLPVFSHFLIFLLSSRGFWVSAFGEWVFFIHYLACSTTAAFSRSRSRSLSVTLVSIQEGRALWLLCFQTTTEKSCIVCL